MANYIWTNHARERNKQRLISEEWIMKTLNDPDEVINEGDSIKSKRRFDHQTVTVITKYNERGENIIISSWINPPTPGSMDYKKEQNYKQMKNASNLKKILLIFLRQIGL